MALHLCRPKHRFPNNPSLIHLFSTSPPDENDDQNPTPNANTNRTSFNYFSDVKARLKTQPTFMSPSSNEIRKNLSEFRQCTAPPPMGESTSSFFSSSQSSTYSFQESYRRRHNNEVQHRNTNVSFDSIRESLNTMRKIKMNDNRGNTNAGGGESGVSWGGSRILGGTQELPSSIFGKEMKAKSGEVRVETGGLKTAFLRTYNVEKLGEKLRELRPEGVKSGEGFSLQELNERLLKLRESEKKSLTNGVLGQDLMESLHRQEDEKKKKRPGVFACPLMLLL